MILVEAYRQIRRLRTWIAFGALAAMPTIVAVAQRTHPERHGDAVDRTLFAVSTASGLNHALAALLFMSPFFLVVVVANFAGESVAGEATWGTLRALLTRPVGRVKLLASKLTVAAALTIAATMAVAIAGLISGTLAFGWHSIRTPFFEIGAASGVWRLALSCLYVSWCMTGVVALAFMLSTMTDHAGGAIGGAIGLAVASQILDSLRSLRWLHPWLPTHYWNAWSELFYRTSRNNAIARGIALQAVYAAVFLGIAFWHFRRKDILS